MSRFDEHLFGRIATLNGYLTQPELQECLELQWAQDPATREPIGKILLEHGYLTDEQLDKILDIRKKKMRKMLLDSQELVRSERNFGQLAMRNGLITLDDLEKAILEQQRLRRMNLRICLGEVMVSLGFMEVSDVLDILTLQNKRILICAECDCHFTVLSYSPNRDYRCTRCQAGLQVPSYLDSVASDGILDENGNEVVDEDHSCEVSS